MTYPVRTYEPSTTSRHFGAETKIASSDSVSDLLQDWKWTIITPCTLLTQMSVRLRLGQNELSWHVCRLGKTTTIAVAKLECTTATYIQCHASISLEISIFRYVVPSFLNRKNRPLLVLDHQNFIMSGMAARP